MQELNLDIYSFVIKSLRDLDRDEGREILKRFLIGPQNIWKETHDKIYSLLDTLDPDTIPNELLKHRKWSVGLTSELDFLTDGLSDDDLRRLIILSMAMWRRRGGRPGIRTMIFGMTNKRALIFDYFDLRWQIPKEGASGPTLGPALSFIRKPELDINLLGPPTIDPIEGLDGEVTFAPNGEFISSEVNFNQVGIYGGERLILDTITPDNPPQITESWESFDVGQIMDSSIYFLLGEHNIPLIDNLFPFPGTVDLLVQNSEVKIGTKALRSRFELGLPLSGGGPDFYYQLGIILFQGQLREIQDSFVWFKLDPTFPGPTFQNNTSNLINFITIAMGSGGVAPVGYVSYSFSGGAWRFHIQGAYFGGAGGPGVEVPLAYLLDNQYHKLTLKLDRSGTIFDVLLDDGAFTWSMPGTILAHPNGFVFANLVGWGQLFDNARSDVPNVFIDDWTFGYNDPEAVNGEYEIERVLASNRLKIKGNWPASGMSNIHYFILGHFSEYNTDIHMDASGNLNKNLVANLLKLNRAPDEQFTVFFWNILDTFPAINRWEILPFVTVGTVVHKTIGDEQFVEINGDNAGIVSNFNIENVEQGYVFETSWEFEELIERRYQYQFGFSLREFTIPLVIHGYMLVLKVDEPSQGNFHTFAILFKFVEGTPTVLASVPIEPLHPAPILFPQLEPDALHTIRCIVAPEGTGLKIRAYINGTLVFDILDVTPLSISGKFTIASETDGYPENTTLLKVHDFKYANLPIDGRKITRRDAVQSLLGETIAPIEVFSHEAFETFQLGLPLQGTGFYGDFIDFTLELVDSTIYSALFLQSSEVVDGAQAIEARVSGANLPASSGINEWGFVLHNFGINKLNTVSQIIRLEIDLKTDFILLEPFKEFGIVFGIYDEGTDMFDPVREINLSRSLVAQELLPALFSKTTTIYSSVKSSGVDLESILFDSSFHTIILEADREASFIKFTIDDPGTFELVVDDTEVPTMLPIDSANDLINAVRLYIRYDNPELGVDVIPFTDIFKADALKLTTTDVYETFEKFQVGADKLTGPSFYGDWLTIGFPEVVEISNAASMPGGGQSMVTPWSTPLPNINDIAGGASQLVFNEPTIKLLNTERIRLTTWFKGVQTPSFPGVGSYWHFSLGKQFPTGGDSIRIFRFDNWGGATYRFQILSPIGGAFTAFVDGMETFLDNNWHKVTCDYYVTTNNLLSRILIDDVVKLTADTFSHPAMTSPVQAKVLASFHSTQNQSGVPWAGGTDSYTDRIILEGFPS